MARCIKTHRVHRLTPPPFLRVVVSACFAAVLFVPFHRMVNARFGEGTVKAAVQKTLADVFGMTPFVGVPTFFMWTSAMQGHTLPEFKERVRANYPTTAFGSIGATRPCLRYSCI